MPPKAVPVPDHPQRELSSRKQVAPHRFDFEESDPVAKKAKSATKDKNAKETSHQPSKQNLEATATQKDRASEATATQQDKTATSANGLPEVIDVDAPRKKPQATRNMNMKDLDEEELKKLLGEWGIWSHW